MYHLFGVCQQRKSIDKKKQEWEGLIYHRRKSGDSVPIWTQILPINYRKGFVFLFLCVLIQIINLHNEQYHLLQQAFFSLLLLKITIGIIH